MNPAASSLSAIRQFAPLLWEVLMNASQRELPASTLSPARPRLVATPKKLAATEEDDPCPRAEGAQARWLVCDQHIA